jgi:integrase
MARQRCLELFQEAIKSKYTQKTYLYQLTRFRDWANLKTFNQLLLAPDKDLQILLEDYVMYLKSRISPNTIPIYFAPIELFYVMNDKNLNFKKMRKLFPEKVKKGNQRGYTIDEIRSMLDNCVNKRQRSLIALLASSGVRIGAVPDMKIRHMTKINDSYAIMIYEEATQEDYVFTTPEATSIIDNYLDERRQNGEYLGDDSPLFRSEYQLGNAKVDLMTNDSIAHLMTRLVLPVKRKKSSSRKRFDVARNHGFRKFFATAIKLSMNISPTMSEKLINHIGISKLDGSYFKPTMQEMYEAYRKAIPELTISNEQRDHLKIESLKKEVETIDDLKTRLEIVEKQKEIAQTDLKEKVEEHQWDIQTMKNGLIADVIKELEQREKKTNSKSKSRKNKQNID